MKNASSEKQNVSRREFFTRTAAIGGGAACLTLGYPLAAGLFSEESTARGAVEYEYPWGYEKIDPEQAAEIAYEQWYKGLCSQATVSGVLVPLQESIGEPYTSLPLEAFHFGHGGVVGWGTICGVLFGSGIALSFVAGTDGESILNELIYWYSDTALPTYTPLNPKSTIQNQTTSDSPLCHISVGKWMKKEGVGLFTPERKERCARVAASTAHKTVTLLNSWADGEFEAKHPFPTAMCDMATQMNCVDCHKTEIPTTP
ncbi:MAG TPA: C-GCAxxG-C-C family protein [bacterium]|nr:C-GCAxxG-C-C family protein [bacterium]